MHKYLKILCCDHFLNCHHRHFSKDCYFDVNDKFYECPHEVNKHEFVALKCILCKYNLSRGFERNYYASISCFCKEKHRKEICEHCERLKSGLKIKILKICMRVEDFPYCNFNYIELNDYLKDLLSEGFFYFSKSLNRIKYLIDNPE